MIKSALPYRGNEVELIEFYNNPDPTNPAILRTDKVDEHVYTTFADGTVKAAKNREMGPLNSIKEYDVRITPGRDTPLDRLGVERVVRGLPDQGSDLLPEHHVIEYKDGQSIERKVDIIMTKDDQQKVLETTVMDDDTHETYVEKPDGATSYYNADGSYVTAWPKKADGTQQFYDSKQQKLFVRDANDNIIPPKD